ncbi:DUF4347 domain-containing protein [Pseudomonas sp. BN414]|uniref:DUF4347 domain-containing protein n=1 Tax=Pseudomonas sp. BN414 TaxID=2567888 RepID=UPI0024566FA5|nr:DUF4347 domain-containing protein [Pseudomonas sp. BN414]MDH4568073.1 DUF4347 domain-containing protein [Pseudomonas sp. BN414]
MWWKKTAREQAAAQPARSAIALALEARMMFDGAVAATAVEAADAAPASDVSDAQGSQADAPQHDNATDNLAAAPSGTADNRQEVVFVDSNVRDYQQLVSGLKPGTEVVVLDANKDGLQQIADYLDGRSGIDAIHILSHGDVGKIQLGNDWLDGGDIAARSELLDAIGQSLDKDGDILVYGCRVGADGAGNEFVQALANATGADVAASDDMTGAAGLGGDWTLEQNLGTVETSALLGLEAYYGLLATPADQNFDALPVAGQGSNSATIGGVTYFNNDSVAISIVNDGFIAAGTDHALGYRSTGPGTSTEVGFKTQDGSEFKLNSFVVDRGFGGDSSFTISAYRNGVLIDAKVVDVTSGTATFNVSVDSKWEYIDEVRITGADLDVDIDDINFSDAVIPDTTPPTVTSVSSSTANGTYKAGDVISVTVTFSEVVTVTGTPRLTLETGAIDRVINYSSGSGTSTLTFNYTVQAGDTNADLDYLSTGALALNGGTIRDAAANNATLTLASPGAAGSLGANKAIVIDSAPSISNVNGDSVAWAGVGNTVTLDSGSNAVFSDTEKGALNSGNGNWAGGSLTVQRSGTAVSADTFGFNTAGALFTVNGNTLESGGQTFATFTSTGGVLTITFTSSGTAATTALINNVAQRVTYRSDTPAGDATVRFTLSDGASSATADVTVTSDTIYVTNTSDVSIIDASNGVGLREAVAIAAGDATGQQTIVFGSGMADQTITLGSGLSLTENLTFNADAAAGLTITGSTITLGGGTSQTVTHSTGTVTLGSTLAGTGTLLKQGAGTLALTSTGNEANMSGGIRAFNGTLQISDDDNLSSGTLVLSGGTLSNNNASFTVDNAINLGIGGIIDVGGTAATQLTLSGVISGSDGGTLLKSGQGILQLDGNNTYTDGTSIMAGTLILGHANALGTTAGSTLVWNGATLRVTGGLTVAENLVIQGTGTQVSSVNYGALHLISGSSTLSGTVNLGSANISVTSGSTLTISGALSGTTDLTKTDSGTLILSNSNNEAGFTGGTTVTGGTLSIGNDDYLGSGLISLDGGTLAISGGTTVDNAIWVLSASTINNSATATLSGSLGGSGSLTKTGASTLTLSGNNTHIGGVNLSAGGLTLSGGSALGNNSAVTLSASTVLTVSTAEIIGSLAGSGSLVLNATLTTGANNTSTTYSGVISGLFGLTKAGSGTLTLTGNNSYTGATNVSAGGLTLNRVGGALDDNTSVTVASGATLTVSADETIDALSGAGTVALGTSALTVGINGTSSTFSGAITGSGTLALDGGGTFTLSGTNSGQSWGLQVLSGGTVAIAGDANLGSGTVQLNDGTLSVTSTGTIDNAITLGASAGRVSVDSGLAVSLSGAIGGAGALTKTGSGTLTLSGGNNYSGTTTVSAGTLAVAGDGNLGAGAVTLAAGTTLQVTGATTINNAFNLGGAATFQTDAAVTVSGAITGGGSLTKTGAGTLTLSSLSSNYLGGTTLAAGTLSVQSSAALGSGTITFNGGALDVSTTTALAFSNAVNMATAGSISFIEDAEATFSGAFSGTGGLTVTGVISGNRELLTLSNSGNSTTWSGTLTATNAALQFAADNMLSSGTITLNSGSVLLNTASTTVDNDVVLGGAGILFSNAGDLVLSGVMSGSGALTTGGTTGTSVTLSGINTHTGSVTVAAGKLILSGGSAVSDSAAVTVSNSTTLELASSETIGSLAGTAGNTLALGSNTLTTGGNNSNTSFAGGINGTGSLVKTGSGTLTLSGSNTFTGGVQVSAGGLTASGGAAIADTALVNVDSGATFTLSATETIGALSGAGTVQLNSNTLSTGGTNLSTTFSGSINGSGNLIKTGTGTFTLSGSNGYLGTTTVGGGGTLSITDASNLSVNTLGLNNGGTLEVTGSNVTLTNAIVLDTGGGRISNAYGLTLAGVLTNSNSFTKLGAGTLTLTGGSNYTGATNVNAGTLLVNGALAGTSSLTVASGATLGGNGSIFANSSTNTLTVQSGGVLSPGNSAGTLTVNGNLQMNAGSILAVEINGTTAGTQYDQVVVNGTVDVSGATLAVTHGYTPGLGDTYTLISNDLNDSVTGNFSGLAEGATLAAGGNSTELTVSYVGATGNDFTLTAPTNEPPVVGNLNGDSVGVIEGGGAALLDSGSDATVTDSDSVDFDGGKVTVAIIANRASGEDFLSILNQGTGAGQIGVSGSNVTFGGVVIGTFTGGTGSNDLVISLNANATPAAVQALVRTITYTNGNTLDPSTATRTVRITVDDGDGATSANADIAVSVTGVNDAPTLSATGGTSTYTENGAAVDLFSGVSVGTVEAGQTITGLTLTVSNLANGASEILRIDGTDIILVNGTSGTTTGGNGISYSVSVSGGTATVTLAIAGGLSTGNVQTVIDGMSYRNSSETPSGSSRAVTLTSISDSGGTSNGGVNSTSVSVAAMVGIEAVNDGPSITAPGFIAVTEDVTTALTGISFADIDAGTGSVTATFSVASGTLAATSGSGVIVGGSGTGSLTLTGRLADINAFIAASGLSFTTASNATASVTLTVAIDDGGNTGSDPGLSGTGSSEADSTTLTLAVLAVNDAPVNSAPASAIVDQDDTLVFSSGNGNLITISDVDAGGGTVRVTLTATNGLITLSSLTGLVFTVGTGTGDASMTFDGSIADINIALSGLTFSPITGYNGPASIQITTSDLGGTGSGGVQTDTDTINITVNPINPLVTDIGVSNPDGGYKVGDVITVTISFDQTVVVDTSGGLPSLLLETGLLDRTATYVSGSGSNTLTFSYTVQAGDVSADLDYQSTGALALNGATIRNVGSDDAILTLPAVGGADSIAGQHGIVIDGLVPQVTSVSVPANGTYVAGQNLDFTVSLSEAVIVDTIGGTPRIAITLDGGGTVFANYLSGSGTSALVFRLTVSSGQLDTNGISVGGAIQANGGTLRDGVGNNANTTLNNVASTTGVRVDAVVPTVASVSVPVGVAYNAGDTLSFVVNASEAVFVNGTPRLSLDIGGNTVFAQYVSGSGTSTLVFQYVVVTGDTDADGIAVNGLEANGGTLRDAAGNSLDLALNNIGDTSGVIVDTLAPVSNGIVTLDPSPTNADSVRYTVTFSEAVSGVDLSDFDLVTGGTAAGSLTGLVQLDAQTYQVTVSGVSGTGTLGLNLKGSGTGIVDQAGNELFAGLTGAVYSVDRDVPTVTSVSVPANGTYVAGQNLDFTVNLSEAVIVDTTGGTPRVAITLDGGGTVFANYLSGSGTSALVFRLTVSSGQLDTNGVSVGGAIQANGGTLRDSVGNNANTTLNNVASTTGVRVDAVVPTVASVSVPVGLPYNAGDTLSFVVNASEAVIVNGTPRLALDIGGTTVFANYVTGSGTSTLVFQYTIQAGDNDANGIAVTGLAANGGTLRDAAGNNMNLALNSAGDTSNLIVDTQAPSPIGIVALDPSPTNAGSVRYTVTFDENVSGVDLGDFALITTGTAGGSLTGLLQIDARTFQITVSGVSGTGTLGLNLNGSATGIVDVAGNAITGGLTGAVYSVDRDVPTVTGVSAPVGVHYNAGDTLTFVVNASEAVIVNGIPQLAIDMGGVTVFADYVAGSGSNTLVFQYTVRAGDNDTNGIAVTGLVANGATLRDAIGNSMNLTLNGVGNTSGVIVDTTAPNASATVAPLATPGSVQYTVTFDESVSGVDLGDFNLVTTGNVTGTLQSLTQVDSRTFLVTVSNVAGAGTLSLGLNATGTLITDTAGNPMLSGLSAQTYSVPQSDGDPEFRTNPPIIVPPEPTVPVDTVLPNPPPPFTSPLIPPPLFEQPTLGSGIPTLGNIFINQGALAPSFIAQVFGSSDGFGDGSGSGFLGFGGGDGGVFGSSSLSSFFDKDVPQDSEEMKLFDGKQWKGGSGGSGQGIFGAPTLGQQLQDIKDNEQRQVRELAMALGQIQADRPQA